MINAVNSTTAIIVALVSSWIFCYCEKHKIGLKMPEGVPTGVARAFAALVPGFFILLAEGYEPSLKAIHDSSSLLLLFLGLIVLGVAITVFSTNRSIIKYLKMRLDDLY